MEVITFVTVKGALEARALYQEVFGATQLGEITYLTQFDEFKEDKYQHKVGHMTLQIGDTKLFINDEIEEQPMKHGETLQLVVNFETEEALRNAFALLAEEGQIITELQEVFWGALFGTVKDKFDVYWQIYYGHK